MKHSHSYEDVPVEILDRQVRRLRNKEVASSKILWRSLSVEGATLEAEEAMEFKYPHLFPSDFTLARGNSSSSFFQSLMRSVLESRSLCLYLHFQRNCMFSELNLFRKSVLSV